MEERQNNLKYFAEDFRRPPIPKDLNCEVKRIQKFISHLRYASENDSLIEECTQLNLRMHLPDVIKNIALSKLGPSERDLLMQICVHLHRRYEHFSNDLVKAIKD